MHLRERTLIDRPVAIVWPFIATAEHFQAWNDKIAMLDASGPFQLGQRFATHYAFKGEPTQFRSEVTQLEEGRLLELRHSSPFGRNVRSDMEVTERVTLTPRGARTLVTKDVTVRNHGLPLLLRPLIWLITRLGRPAGENKLAALCESASPPG